jgi:enoyl-CoA hydratase/carnithine racemase
MSIKTTRTAGVLTVTLDRADNGNRLDPTIIDRLIAEFSNADPLADGPACLLLTAIGPDFSLGRQRPTQQSLDPLDIVAEFEHIQRLNEAVQRCRAVTISAIRGRAEGAGLSLAGRCDIVLVAENASLSFPEIPHGIPPTIVLSHYRYVLPPNLLGDLIFTGREVQGREAVQIGLAARVVPEQSLDGVAADLSAKVAGYDRRSIALVKRFLAESQNLTPSQAPALGISLYANEMSSRLMKKL